MGIYCFCFVCSAYRVNMIFYILVAIVGLSQAAKLDEAKTQGKLRNKLGHHGNKSEIQTFCTF